MPKTPSLSRDELNDRIADQTAELEKLVKQRDALDKK